MARRDMPAKVLGHGVDLHPPPGRRRAEGLPGPPQGALEQIPIGASQDQVLIVMGTPSTVATLNGEVFYYISQRTERPVAFMPQKTIDQRVIAIYFDKNRQVRRLANYGVQDGRIFDFISRTTPTGGQEMSVLGPLFRLINPN